MVSVSPDVDREGRLGQMPAFDRRRRSPLRGRVATRARRVDATLSASAGVATARAPGRGRGVSIARPLAGPASAGKQPDPKSCSLRGPRIPSALVDPQQNATRPLDAAARLGVRRKQQSHGTKSSRSTLPVWNARSHADRRSNGCPSAQAMRHQIAVSQDCVGCKHKSSSVLADDDTAAVGARRPPCASCPARARV
jgi:hypothetical protein